ncbi:MAG: hypothetical protein JWP97_177 [Labilithrix sp.]|nr:hypothetical protein [Labilithrix sp.]
MKNVMVALLCTLGAVAACSDRHPAQSPTTTSSTTTSDTSATAASGSNHAAASGATAGDTTTAANGGDTSGTPHAQQTYPQPAAVAPLGAAGDHGTANGATAAGTSAAGATTASNGDPNATNTKKNERDRNGATLTPMDQGAGKDRDITAAVRRAVVADGSLSFNAKNVKIITQNGKVTLRGPVKSDAEKANIEQKTRAAAGVVDVDNQLEVKK